MAKNLYDLLEVSQSASQEAIATAYKRLYAKLAERTVEHSEDATNQMIALREAYNTLSDPERRRRYDDRLKLREAELAPPADQRNSFLKLALFAAVIGISGVLYAKHRSEQEKIRLESERIAAEAKAAESALQRQREEKQAADEAYRQRLRDEAIARADRERDIAYGNQVSRNLQFAEQRAKLNEQREAQQRQYAERQQQYEAERQLAKDKAYLRQLEAENSRSPRYWNLSR